MPLTLKEWVICASQALADHGITSAKLDAELILAHALQKDRSHILMHPHDVLPKAAQAAATKLLNRRKNQEPMAYILGYREFYGLTLKTDSRALIPRGESETLVEAALAWLTNQDPGKTVVEIGTGSGAIILALAANAPGHNYVATDISLDALTLAQENAASVQLTSITFLEGSLTEPLVGRSVDLLAANLPYIATPVLESLAPTITGYEPHIALDGGGDGIEPYRQLFSRLTSLMAPHGLILCEHEYNQAEAMRKLAHLTFPQAEIKTLQDYLGEDRVLWCKLT